MLFTPFVDTKSVGLHVPQFMLYTTVYQSAGAYIKCIWNGSE